MRQAHQPVAAPLVTFVRFAPLALCVEPRRGTTGRSEQQGPAAGTETTETRRRAGDSLPGHRTPLRPKPGNRLERTARRRDQKRGVNNMPSDQELQAEWLARNQPTKLPTVYLMPIPGAAPVKLEREIAFPNFRDGVKALYQRANISRAAHAKRRLQVIIQRLTERHTIEEMQAICKDEGITMSWLRKMTKAAGYDAPGAHKFTGGPKIGRVEFRNLIIAEYTPDQTYANVVRIAKKHNRTADGVRQMLKYAGFDVPKGSRWNG